MTVVLEDIESASARMGAFVLLVGFVIVVWAANETGVSAWPFFYLSVGGGVGLLAVSFGSYQVQHLSDSTIRRIAEAVMVTSGFVAVGLLFHVTAAEFFGFVTGQSGGLVELLTQKDAGWYRSIVVRGYQGEPNANGQANWAFFPLYPLIVWVVKTATGLPAYSAGILVSITCLILGGTVVYRYLSETRTQRVATLAVALLAIGPYSFYNYTMYTESLFICLVAIGFWYLHVERYVTAAVVGALLSATRGVGGLFGVAIVVHLLMHTDAFDRLWAVNVTSGSELAQALYATLSDRRVLSLSLVPTGLLLFMAHLWTVTGDPLAFVNVLSAWNRSPGNPVIRPIAGLAAPKGENRYLSLVSILVVSVGIDLVRRRRVVEGIFGLLALLIPLSSSLTSMPRYAFGSTVIVFGLAELLDRGEYVRLLGFGGLVALNGVLVIAWYSGDWVVA